MAKVTEVQEVKLFSDEETIGKQEVLIDTDDPCGTWIHILHSGS